MESPWTENEDVIMNSNNKLNKLNGDLVLNNFNNWLELNRIRFDEFDHAFGVTACVFFLFFNYKLIDF